MKLPDDYYDDPIARGILNDGEEPDFDSEYDADDEPDWGDDEDTTTEDVFTVNGNDPPPF